MVNQPPPKKKKKNHTPPQKKTPATTTQNHTKRQKSIWNTHFNVFKILDLISDHCLKHFTSPGHIIFGVKWFIYSNRTNKNVKTVTLWYTVTLCNCSLLTLCYCNCSLVTLCYCFHPLFISHIFHVYKPRSVSHRYGRTTQASTVHADTKTRSHDCWHLTSCKTTSNSPQSCGVIKSSLAVE